MVEQAKRQIWRKGGRFYGYRINCEQVPMLGACTVRAILDDPRMIPYLVIWKSRKGNEVKQAVRLARSVPRTNLSEVESVDIKWPDGSTVRVYLVWRRQPHGGCALLLRCSRCGLPQAPALRCRSRRRWPLLCGASRQLGMPRMRRAPLLFRGRCARDAWRTDLTAPGATRSR